MAVRVNCGKETEATTYSRGKYYCEDYLEKPEKPPNKLGRS